MIDALPLLLAPEGYQISRSVRLRSSASAYFSRTLSTPSSGTTWTLSGWIKRGTLGVENQIFSAGAAVSDQIFFQNSTDVLIVYLGTNTLVTSQVFRDPSSWYHIVLQVDTTQATTSNRVRLYVNGIQVTAFSSTSYPAQNATTKFNSASAHNIGRYQAGASGYFDGYLAEINFIDGQALTPSSFGETDVITGVWKPKKYAGTYGTNGFYLNFSDNSAATAAAIGKDYSGNGNNWTPNNISVTAGVTYDSMIDVPTMWADGGNGRGNYAVLNPLSFTGSGGAASSANLFFASDAPQSSAPATIFVNSGKWYAEFTPTITNAAVGIGVGSTQSRAAFFSDTSGNGFAYYADGRILGNAGNVATGLATFTNNDIVGVALDMDARSVAFYKNNTLIHTQTTGFSTEPYTFFVGDGSVSAGVNVVANFGQRPFSFSPPSGFKALNTQNLPEPLVKKGNQYFDATTYTGTGVNGRSVVNAGAFQPDLVWVKARNGAYYNVLFDSVRGTNKQLSSNATDAEVTSSVYGYVSSFNTDGFSVWGGSTDDLNVNDPANIYVGWQWKKGATQGFDIQAITAQASGSATFSHSLGVAPAMYIVKPRANVGGWNVYHQSLGANKVLALNGTGAAATSTTTWNNTAPTSSVFSLGTDYAGFGTQIVYLFAEVAGFSKFGSYTGNGSADGVFVYTGMMPRFILIKRTDAAGSWYIHDTARGTYNVLTPVLYADLSNAEGNYAAGTGFDVLSNGFKARTTNTEVNASGGTYVYAAFASNPFKNSLAR